MAGVEVSGVLVNNSGPFLTHYAFEGAGENSLTRVSAYFNLTQHATKVEFKGESLTELNVVGQKELDQSPFMVALKVISYCTVIIPLIMLIIHAIVRSRYTVTSQSSPVTSTPGGYGGIGGVGSGSTNKNNQWSSRSHQVTGIGSDPVNGGSLSPGLDFNHNGNSHGFRWDQSNAFSESASVDGSVRSIEDDEDGISNRSDSGEDDKDFDASLQGYGSDNEDVFVENNPELKASLEKYGAFLNKYDINQGNLYENPFLAKREVFKSNIEHPFSRITANEKPEFMKGYDELSDRLGEKLSQEKGALNESVTTWNRSKWGNVEFIRDTRKIFQAKPFLDERENLYKTLTNPWFLLELINLGLIQGYKVSPNTFCSEQIEIFC